MVRVGAWTSAVLLALVFSLGLVRWYIPRHAPLPQSLAALDAGPQCEMPCWQGIRPGITRMTEAAGLLLLSPLLDRASIAPACSGCIAFTMRWREPTRFSKPTAVDTLSFDVLLEPEYGQDRVARIVLHVGAPLGDFMLHFGPPTVIRAGQRPDAVLYQTFEYPDIGMSYTAYAPCAAGQNAPNLAGSIYLLHAPDDTPERGGGSVVAIGWRGLTSYLLDAMVWSGGCTP